MNRDDLLHHIAEAAYNVGFGAKRNFASHDMLDSLPGKISFVITAVGVYALVSEPLSTKLISATMVVLGILGLYISSSTFQKPVFDEAGASLTGLFNDLKRIYLIAKSAPEEDLPKIQEKLQDIEERYIESCVTRQLPLSNWLAHYKFFWEQQIDWIDEQLHFSLFRDKIPLTLTVTLSALLIGLIVHLTDFSLVLEFAQAAFTTGE